MTKVQFLNVISKLQKQTQELIDEISSCDSDIAHIAGCSDFNAGHSHNALLKVLCELRIAKSFV